MDRLEAARLVRRERVDTDRRGAVVVVTPEGDRALRRAWPVYAKGINDLFLAPLTDGEVSLLGEALGRVDAASRRSEPGERP